MLSLLLMCNFHKLYSPYAIGYHQVGDYLPYSLDVKCYVNLEWVECKWDASTVKVMGSLTSDRNFCLNTFCAMNDIYLCVTGASSIYIFGVWYYQWKETCPDISWFFKLTIFSISQTKFVHGSKGLWEWSSIVMGKFSLDIVHCWTKKKWSCLPVCLQVERKRVYPVVPSGKVSFYLLGPVVPLPSAQRQWALSTEHCLVMKLKSYHENIKL